MDLRQLIKAFDAGRIDADTLVWRKGMPDWSRLRDVSELAERLLGSEVVERLTGPNLTGPNESSAEAPTRGSSPPPAHERSRTPPASYAVPSADGTLVGLRRSGTVPLGEPPRPVAPAAVETPTAPSAAPPLVAAPGHVEGAATSEELSRPSGRANRRRSSRSQPAHARPSGPPRAVAAVTQTGLESPASVNKRTSVAPGAASNREAGSGRASVASAPSSRQSREPRSAKSGSSAALRRPPSNDETPAQKPSSVSVPPPGTVNTAPAHSNGRRWLALAAFVVGGGVWLGLSNHEPPAPMSHVPGVLTRPAEQPAPEPLHIDPAERAPSPQRPANDALGPPGVTAPAAINEPPVRPSEPRALTPAPVMAKPVREVASVQRRRTAPVANSPVAPKQPALAVQAAKAPSSAAPNLLAPTLPNAASGTASAPTPAQPGSVATPAAATAPAAAGPDLSTPTVANPGTAAPAPAAPAEFDTKSAEQQLGVAAWKASTCGPMGPTRGSGQVSISIETWGRVVRVTHLNQSFVGTPVGLCVMQAFQQVRVSPFQGSARTITGSFVVE